MAGTGEVLDIIIVLLSIGGLFAPFIGTPRIFKKGRTSFLLPIIMSAAFIGIFAIALITHRMRSWFSLAGIVLNMIWLLCALAAIRRSASRSASSKY
jgi:hypothetical protein